MMKDAQRRALWAELRKQSIVSVHIVHSMVFIETPTTMFLLHASEVRSRSAVTDQELRRARRNGEVGAPVARKALKQTYNAVKCRERYYRSLGREVPTS